MIWPLADLNEILFNLSSFKLILVIAGWCIFSEMAELCWWWINSGSGNGLVPSGTKPLPEPVLTQIYNHVATMTSCFNPSVILKPDNFRITRSIINTMATDALAPCITRSSVAMVLNIFYKDGFHLHMESQTDDWRVKYNFMFSEIN